MSADKLDEIAERLWEHPTLNGIRAALDEARKEALYEWRRPTQADEKYGRDHGERITMGELVKKVMAEHDPDRFLDALDSEFLIGCWGIALKSGQDPNLLRDLRGFIVEALKYARQEDRAEIERLKTALHQSREVEGGAQTAVLDQRAEIERLRAALDADKAAMYATGLEQTAEIERLRERNAEVNDHAMQCSVRAEAAEAKLAETQAVLASRDRFHAADLATVEAMRAAIAAARAKTAKLEQALRAAAKASEDCGRCGHRPHRAHECGYCDSEGSCTCAKASEEKS